MGRKKKPQRAKTQYKHKKDISESVNVPKKVNIFITLTAEEKKIMFKISEEYSDEQDSEEFI